MHVCMWVTVCSYVTCITDNYYNYHHYILHILDLSVPYVSNFLLVQLGTLKVFSIDLKGFYHLNHFLSKVNF